MFGQTVTKDSAANFEINNVTATFPCGGFLQTAPLFLAGCLYRQYYIQIDRQFDNRYNETNLIGWPSRCGRFALLIAAIPDANWILA